MSLFFPRKFPLLLLCISASLLATFVAVRSASAIPAFARQYGRDCQTCHVAFPKLTAFGEAFRRNGYRFPGGNSQDYEEEESIPLGQEAYKKLFPHTVWPGNLPAQVRLAAQIAMRVDYLPDDDPEISFDAMSGSLGLNFASNFDETFSAWAGVAFRSEGGAVETEVERIFAMIEPFDTPVMNFRLGRFDPELWSFSNHRTLGFAPWMMVTPVLDNPFTPHPAQSGFEATGVTGQGRFTYSVGVVEGGGDRVNTFKDVYSHIGVKIGGMRLDGLKVQSASAQAWREKSVQIGGFGYFGQSALGDRDVASQEDRFFIVGGDVNAVWRDFNLILAGTFGRNQMPSLAEPNQSFDSVHFMSQLDIVVYPWLIPTARWERKWLDSEADDRLSGGVYFLLRANVRTQILASIEEDDKRFLAGLNIVL